MNAPQCVFAAILLASAGRFLGAQQTLSGTIRDSATGRPLPGAVVELRVRDTRRGLTQTDDVGGFQLRVGPNEYTLLVRRLGYAQFARTVEVGNDDLSLDIGMVRVAHALDAIKVTAGTGIFGMIGTSERLDPIAGARVQVIGANRSRLTDSTGAFFVPLDKPGVYVVRVTRQGYGERRFPITVADGIASDASRLLDTSLTFTRGLDALWDDFDQRLRWRSINSVLLPGGELRAAGGSLTDAIETSRAFSLRGLRIGNSTCLFMNGTPRPGMTLDVIPMDRIEILELYGEGDPGARYLAQKWPARAECGPSQRSTRYEPAGAARKSIARWAVVWMKP